MAAEIGIEIASRRVASNSVILEMANQRSTPQDWRLSTNERTYPDDDSSWLITRTNLDISALGEMVKEEVEEVIGFLFLETDNTARKAFVHVKSLLACDWMHANQRMLQHIFTSARVSCSGSKEPTSDSTGSLLTGPPIFLEYSA